MSEAIHQAGNDGYALSPEQQVVLSDPLLRSERAVFSATLKGPWHGEDLRRACEQVFLRHDILRTVFRQTPGYTLPRQYPLEGELPQLEVFDARHAKDDDFTRLQLAAAQLEESRLARCVLLLRDDDGARLVLSASRLVADEVGLASLYRNVLDVYAGLHGDESETEFEEDNEPVQYTQFVEWREELAIGEEARDGAAYWTRYLERLTAEQAEVPALPYRKLTAEGRASLTQQPEEGHEQARSIRSGIDCALDSAARVCGVTPAVLAQAAWWLLLARIAGAEQVVGAWQHDSRDGVSMLEGSIGAFARAYPVALACPDERPFADLANEFGTLLDAHTRWQEHWPANPATLDRPLPAFDQVGFSLASVVPDWTLVRGAEQLGARADRIHALLPGYELALQIDVDATGSLRAATLGFRADRYSDADVQALLGQYVTLLAAVAANPAAAVGALAIDNGERQSRLLAWKGEARDWTSCTLPATIAAWAATTPDAPALAAADLSISYAELEARVAHAAAMLNARGVGRGSVVGLLLPRSAALVVALLATMRAGAAYLPLDPAWPAARREEIVAQAGVRVVLCERGASAAPGYLEFDALIEGPGGNVDAGTNPDPGDNAYVLYTSGSTGKPKGVAIGHRQLFNYVAGSSEALGLDRCRRFALTSTVAADLGNTTLFGALYNGGCLVVAQADDIKDAQSFAAFVQHNRIDCLKITPSHLGALLDAGTPCVPDVVVLGGEPVPTGLAARLRTLNPAARLFNHYGPTETTIGVLVHEYRGPDDSAASASNLPLTAVLPNCHVYVLDRAMRLAPVGATGELYIGGAQVSSGYVGQDEQDVFVDDPFNPGERLYRSGDRARYLAGGGIQLVGRADAQVKIRGFRIEPAEIEAELLRIPGVREAAVRAWGDEAGRQLAAYVVYANSPTQSAGDAGRGLREQLAQRLPDAMVPAHFVALPDLPRLANGKIDRRSLPDPRERGAAAQAQAPRTAVETLLLRTISDFIGQPLADIDANFFDAGADSLVAIRLASRIREQLRIEVLPGVVFSHPTARQLAQALSAASSSGGEIERVARLRLRFDAMTPEERERLLHAARDAKQAQAETGTSA
ncbi:amino acid adenylation domain-containing protein [Paraburkholderia sp. J12]|uniref:non-ribosomal peptide synthetase n=1 Tax=Paraburkholderia sp. J12 TaxID=2805432 RepID=UPI002ABDF796|nr:amino acid adenylation domain-containing protein [Paraburkholderia sp. J12]